MVVIIPCAGRGTRMYPASKNCPKILLPYQDKLILDHIVESLLAVNRDAKFVFVINSRLGYMIREHIAEHYSSLDVKFSTQTELLGFGHGVLQARNHVSEDPVLIHASDKIFEFTDFETDVSWMGIRTTQEPTSPSAILVRDGYVDSIIEKPRVIWSAVCYIRETELLFQSLQKLVDGDIRTEGEYQMTDALSILIHKGIKIKSVPVHTIYEPKNEHIDR